MRDLGDQIELAWLRGWDAGVVGKGANANPYRRRTQAAAFERGRQAAQSPKPFYVRRMQEIVTKRQAANLPIR